MATSSEANIKESITTNSSMVDEVSYSETSSPIASRESSSSDLSGLSSNSTNAIPTTSVGVSKAPPKKLQTLQERSKVPVSFYISLGIIAITQLAGTFWSMGTIHNYVAAMTNAKISLWEMLTHVKTVMEVAATTGQIDDWKEFTYVVVVTFLVGCLLYVLIGAPLMAGVWTLPRSRKHKIHRYMGLLYLIQYGAAWIHYLTNYEEAKHSYLTHFIALNGYIQGYSAFFSFKVLPELQDPGYYSDKAVMSRNFVHENIFYTVMAIFGSAYYNDQWRVQIQSDLLGKGMEILFVFFPYVLLRPFFPITHFSKAGTTRNGRSKQNELFYRIATPMVKLFYLWAKYFLGFFVNFLVYLDLLTPKQWKVLHGMYLLNLGTVSIAIFLHTLRFRKILPAKLTFSIYLLQIYATFSAIPIAYDMFTSHKALCGLCFAGILCNMTRSKPVHAMWCVCAFYLLKIRNDIAW